MCVVLAVRCDEHRLVSSFSHDIPSRFGCAVELRWAEARNSADAPFSVHTYAHTHACCTQGDGSVLKDAYFCDNHFDRLLHTAAVRPEQIARTSGGVSRVQSETRRHQGVGMLRDCFGQDARLLWTLTLVSPAMSRAASLD